MCWNFCVGNSITVKTSASRYSAVETGQCLLPYQRADDPPFRDRLGMGWKQMRSALICGPKRAPVNRLVCAMWAGELNSLCDSLTRGFRHVTFKLQTA